MIIEESPWIPDNGKGAVKKTSKYDKPVSIRIGFRESELRDRVKNTGDRWDNEEKCWILPYRKTVEFGLESRILKCYKKKKAIDIPLIMYNNKYMYVIKEDLK